MDADARLAHLRERFASDMSELWEEDPQIFEDVGWLLARLDAQTQEIHHLHTLAQIGDLGREGLPKCVINKGATTLWMVQDENPRNLWGFKLETRATDDPPKGAAADRDPHP